MIGLYFLFGLIALIVVYHLFNSQKPANPEFKFKKEWRIILTEKVEFYNHLSEDEKNQFEKDISRFLRNIRITGIQTQVTDTDRLLVASSAIIPIFGFPEFEYRHLQEVLLYPSAFDRDYNFKNPKEHITGMVGNKHMEGVVILSKPALLHGFKNARDKKNVGIHEFIHLFDKEDGVIDGIPGFEGKESSMVWIQLIKDKMKEIERNQSDINPYAYSNFQEFLAVTGEYFFERPHLMKKKHPDLYKSLKKVFHQSPVQILQKNVTKKHKIGRNDPCPCGSGEKFKNCCGA